MRLPEKIVGRNKIRDAAIVNDWWENDCSYEELTEKFNLTERRLQQILRENHAYVVIDKEYEKKKRIRRLNKEIKGKPYSRKDVADLLEQHRKELEGNEPLVKIEQHTHYTFVKQALTKSGEVDVEGRIRSEINQ